MTSDFIDTAGNLRDRKRSLRLRTIGARDEMAESERAAAGNAITAVLLARPELATSRVVLATLPFGSEWDTTRFVSTLLQRGKSVALPRVNAESRMVDLLFVHDLDRDVLPGYRGIPEPAAHCAHADPLAVDWILVPGVAFDELGRRLGYGGGYYDRLLPQTRSAVPRIAGAFDLQIVREVPAASHDLRVDIVVTEKRTISAAA